MLYICCMNLIIEKNFEVIHRADHPSPELLFKWIVHEIGLIGLDIWFDRTILKGAKTDSIDIFNDYEQFTRKKLIFKCVHIARIIDEIGNKFDIYIR